MLNENILKRDSGYIRKIRLYIYKKTGLNAKLLFSIDHVVIFGIKIFIAFAIIALWMTWIVSFSHFGTEDANRLKQMPARTLIQYSKNNNKTLVEMKGNIIYKTKIGIIFYTHRINKTKLKQLVTIFIPYSKVETIYN